MIKIGDIEIHSYDAYDKKQLHLKHQLNSDPAFLKYVTKKLEDRLNESLPFEEDNLIFHQSYLVKYKEDFVGYIRLEEDKRRKEIVEIQWAVSPEFRNQKIGSLLIQTISDYILENYASIQKLKGVIEKGNYPSQNMAKKAGFIEENREDNYIYVSKSR